MYKEFKGNNWNAVGCGYSRARPMFEQVNLLDTTAVHNVIQDFQVRMVERRIKRLTTMFLFSKFMLVGHIKFY